MSKKAETYYFDTFIESSRVATAAAQLLETIFKRFDPASLDADMEEMHELEHRGDAYNHQMIAKLVAAFITPIDREDILNLSQHLDDITDSVEDILLHIYINNVTALRDDAYEFAALLIRCCRSTTEMLEEFHNFRKSGTLKQLIVEVNHLEEDGDRLYARVMRRLHTTETDPLLIMAWHEIYDYFEKCCDACEDVADIVESIVIDNT